MVCNSQDEAPLAGAPFRASSDVPLLLNGTIRIMRFLSPLDMGHAAAAVQRCNDGETSRGFAFVGEITEFQVMLCIITTYMDNVGVGGNSGVVP